MNACKITGFFVAAKAVQYLIVFCTPVDQFDTSTKLFLAQYVAEKEIETWINVRFWNKLLAWDAVFFLKTAMTNARPEFEHENAFSSLWSLILRSASRDSTNIYTILKTGVIIENLLHYGAAALLYQLTLKTFESNVLKSHHIHNLAKLSTILFIASSAAGFCLGVYSEPLSTFFTLLGMICRERTIHFDVYGNLRICWLKWPLYAIFSTACFTVAFINRPICIILGSYYLFDLFYLIKARQYKQAMFMPCVSGCCMFVIFLYHQYYLPFQVYCPERGEWCLNTIFDLPVSYRSLYSYIQDYYWNNGILRYWTLNNIPNFLFALPNVVVMWYATVYFSHQYPCFNLKSLVFMSRVFLIIMAFFAHTQVINRVSTFIPLHLWYVADRINKLYQGKDTPMKGDDKLIRYYVGWLLFWIPLQTALYASFLPPA
ncbi:LADA_0F06018g1_1 [Lachancea dasiensis]|uniref:GPI mannosyltransferase 2 n=1 Tax=Lachancea dasiensis TaxID=1072105 RepID=A0A1G4JJM8_9SACH|nr:LADA_0F06018g1_1 [Lachancea dasiensis]